MKPNQTTDFALLSSFCKPRTANANLAIKFMFLLFFAITFFPSGKLDVALFIFF